MPKNRTSKGKQDSRKDKSDSQENSEDEQDQEEEQQYSSDKEEDDELLGVEPDEKVLAWAKFFKDQDKLAELAEKFWSQFDPENKEKIPKDEANKAVVALNKEIQKHVKEAHPAIEEEDPEKFPVPKFSFGEEVGKSEFLASVEDLEDLVDVMEIVGKRLIPGIYDVYNEKYAKKEGKGVDEKVYFEFFDDVAKKIGAEGKFAEVDESIELCSYKDEKHLFDLKSCIAVGLDNFRRENSDTTLYHSKLFSKYSS